MARVAGLGLMARPLEEAEEDLRRSEEEIEEEINNQREAASARARRRSKALRRIKGKMANGHLKV
jgi:hypothetical protein